MWKNFPNSTTIDSPLTEKYNKKINFIKIIDQERNFRMIIILNDNRSRKKLMYHNVSES